MNVMNNKAMMNIKEASPKRGPAAPVNSPPPPPPPNFLGARRMVKKTLLLCLLFLFCIIALPVQSQAPVPTQPPTGDQPDDPGGLRSARVFLPVHFVIQSSPPST